MLIDARQVAKGETLDCDVCIVGAGAAGIAIAHELCDRGMEVILLESGGLKLEEKLEDLNVGEFDLNTHDALELYRRRYFGGATTAWKGRCVPFDEIDFEERSYVPYSGWPITKRELDPYFARSHDYCDIGAYSYEVKESLPPSVHHKSLIPGLEAEGLFRESIYRFSPPTDFGKRYIERLKKATNIKIYIYANCLKIQLAPDGNRVECLKVASSSEKEFSVRAKQYIVAGGGLEITRLLLVSNDVHSKGIGNQHDLVGRFYMCHTANYFNVKFTTSDVVLDYEKSTDGVYCQRTVSVKEDKQREYGLLNHRVFIERSEVEDPSHENGALSAIYLGKSLVSRQIDSSNLGGHVKNVVLDFPSTLQFANQWLTQIALQERKLPAVLLKNRSKTYRLRIDSEQAPNPNSRITLSDNKDSFGQNRLKIDWQPTELDEQSVLKLSKLLGDGLSKCGAGQVCLLENLMLKALGGHHLGTTRMASTPDKGVVDANCQVHGVNNLYLAGSSVFTTSSYANPTLMALALALRLADHIKSFYT